MSRYADVVHHPGSTAVDVRRAYGQEQQLHEVLNMTQATVSLFFSPGVVSCISHIMCDEDLHAFQ